MDKKSAHLVMRATERLFRLSPTAGTPEEQVRFCEWLLQAVWRQLVAVSGPEAANAVFGQAILDASSMWPLVKLVKVTDGGLNASDLRQACNETDCGLVGEACKSVVRTCLSLVVTVSGDSLVVTLVDRVVAEMIGLGAGPEIAGQLDWEQKNPSAA